MDVKLTRTAFSEYLRERYPNDHNTSSAVSMAFFLLSHELDLGMKFADILSGVTSLDDYRNGLVAHFALRQRKNPKSDASAYLRSFKLLIEFLGRNDAQRLMVKPVYPPQQKRRRDVALPTPTVAEVKRYLTAWDTLPNYTAQEKALNMLFRKTYPMNEHLNHVLVKCSVLNDFYGTNIYGVYPIAEHIVTLRIDDRLAMGDKTLVDDIARATSRRNYSFATKYCSHHQPLLFPIYDSYVDDVLNNYRLKDGFMHFTRTALTDYPIFCDAIDTFRKYYGLNEFDLKQIDQYLCNLAKSIFRSVISENRLTASQTIYPLNV